LVLTACCPGRKSELAVAAADLLQACFQLYCTYTGIDSVDLGWSDHYYLGGAFLPLISLSGTDPFRTFLVSIVTTRYTYATLIMPSLNRSSRILLVAALLCTWLSDVTATSNPSDFPSANLRRRSGRLDRPPPQWGPVRKRDGGKPLVVTNMCSETVWPGIGTQAGTGGGTGGFELKPGGTKTLTVSNDWQGRIWGRTNCSFNALGTGASNLNGNNGAGRACQTGDCGGKLSCVGTVSSLKITIN